MPRTRTVTAHFRVAPGARTGFARPVLFCLLVLLAGCIDAAKEQAIGDALAHEINTRTPLIQDPHLNGYVERLGQRLARVSERPSLPYRFYIIDSEAANAFALPGGHLYVTRGLIERTDDVSELGGILAHEIGHVAARHSIRQLERHLRTGSVVGVLYHLILGREPALLDPEALSLGARLWHANHSRAAEQEADALAVSYLAHTGLDPRGLVHLLDSLRDEGIGVAKAEWFSTHPLTAERIEVLRTEVAQHAAVPRHGTHPKAATSYAAFRDRIEALTPDSDTPRPD